MTKVRHQGKFKNAMRDQFFRLRMSEYGATAVWFALKKQRRSWLVTASARARATVMRVQCVQPCRPCGEKETERDRDLPSNAARKDALACKRYGGVSSGSCSCSC